MLSRRHRRAVGALLSGALLVTAPSALAFETEAQSGQPTELYPGALIPDRALAPREGVNPQSEVRQEQLREPEELSDRLPEKVREGAFERQRTGEQEDKTKG